jgi:hypothetical protein
MIVVYGCYRFRPRRVGYRNDYCLVCGREVRSEQIRSFNAIHLFWIPLIPLGFWTRWLCPQCHRPPHQVRGGVRAPFKWAIWVVLLSFAVFLWIIPSTLDSSSTIWMYRLGLSVATALLLAHLIRAPKTPSLKEKLTGVRPASDVVCPFCGTQMLIGDRCSCPNCGVVRYSVQT